MPTTKKRAPKVTAPKAPKAPPVRPNLRDQFAMAAVSGLIAMRQPKEWTNSTKHFVASDAYAIADAMLMERGKKEEKAA